MLRHPDSHLCYKDSVHKDWIIEIVDDHMTIENEKLVQDELTITDPLCSKDDITLGCCESASLEFKVINDGTSYKDKTLNVSLVLNRHTSTPIPIGVFKVEEDELESDQRFRKIKAYDALYTINNKDFAPWFNNLPSGEAITCEDFRNSFFQYAGVEQEEVELINDWVPFQFEVTNSGATKRMLEEETEKVQQAVDKANQGLDIIEPVLIDPDTYDEWDSVFKDTYVPEYKWTPTYTPVENPTENANPKRRGWYERTSDGGYIPTTDKKLVKIDETHYKTYYTRDSVPQVDPAEEGYYYVNDDSTSDHYNKYVPATEHAPVENRQYYLIDTEEIRSPKLWNWYQLYVDGKYDYTLDDEIIVGKDYFLMETVKPETPKYVKVTEFHTGDNPSEKGWYEYDDQADPPAYKRSESTKVAPNVDYFELVIPKNKNTAFLCLTPYIDAHRLDNPKELGWYELVNDAYVKTEDEQVDRTKDYYENIWEKNQNEEKDIVEDQILGADIIQAICEINGCFGHIGRDGKFKYIKLKPIDFEDEGLYPAPDLYPDPNLYPQGQPYDELLDRTKYEEVVRKDYYVNKIDRLVICKEDGDAGYVYPKDSIPDNHNTYKITGNFIWYSFTGDQETLDLVGTNLLTDGVAQISEYTPCEIDMIGNPCLELGDTLKVQTRMGTFYTYVLSRTLTGSQRLKDQIEATGTKERAVENSLYDAVIELKGKSNILKRDVDETRSEIINVSEGLTSLIKQTAESIQLAVSKEIKNTEGKINEKYEASTKYTDSSIKDTVSMEVYNDNQDKIAYRFSEFERLSTQISANVESKLDSEGSGVGFRWILTDSGFVLQSKGGYDLISPVPQGVNPSTMDPWWYEVDSEHAGMKHTTDTTVKEGKNYYLEVEEQDYRTVFNCTKSGCYIEDMVNTGMLNVRDLAIMERVEANTANITELAADNVTIKRNLTAATADIGNIKTKALKAVNLESGTINAEYITGGQMDAARITSSSLTAKVGDSLKIQATQESPTKGKIVIGHVATAEYYVLRTNSSGGKAYYKLIPMGISEAIRQNKIIYVVDESTSYTTNQIPET